MQDIHENSMEFPSNRQDVDGGYLIQNVTLLGVGKWNGIQYTAVELEKATNKWRDNSIWNRHYEDRQRDETNRIGLIRNQHFGESGIIGDVFLSNETPEGQEMIEAVRTNQINGISVEHVDVTIESVATDISFLGAAIVPEPACVICQLSKKELNMDQKDFDELSDTVTELGKSVEKLSNDEIQDTVSKLAVKVKELGKLDLDRIKKLESRIKELEDTPLVNATVESDIEDSYANVHVGKDGINRRV